LAAVAQRLSAFFVRGKGNFLACTIASLYATAFGPLVELAEDAALTHRATYIKLNKNEALGTADVGYLVLDSIILLIVVILLISKFVPMTKVVHKVGRLRAVTICLLTLFFLNILMTIVIKPFDDMIFLEAPF
jgi:hypothetical protein